MKGLQEGMRTIPQRAKQPRKGSMAYEIARLGPVARPIMILSDTAVECGATLDEIIFLLRSGYRGAVRRRDALLVCNKLGHDVAVGGSRALRICKRCGDLIEDWK